MKLTKNQINKRIKKKTNLELVETINLAKKNNLLELARELGKPRKLQKKFNLSDLEKIEKNKILIPGKVLGSGNITKKKEIIALKFSENAKQKLEKAGCKLKIIKQEINSNKKLDGIEII